MRGRNVDSHVHLYVCLVSDVNDVLLHDGVIRRRSIIGRRFCGCGNQTQTPRPFSSSFPSSIERIIRLPAWQFCRMFDSGHRCRHLDSKDGSGYCMPSELTSALVACLSSISAMTFPVPRLWLIPHGPWPTATNTPPAAPGFVTMSPRSLSDI